MNEKVFVYTGSDNLEAMVEAKNYNDYLVDKIVAQLGEGKKKILDFGAGTGTYADLLLAQNIKVECLEPDHTLATKITEKGFRTYQSTRDIRSNSFDMVYALNVLEHIENEDETIKELQRILKPGGKILIYVPAFQMLFSPMDHLVGHYRRYRKADLVKLANNNKLSVVNMGYCDPLGFFMTVIYKMVGNKSGKLSPRSVRFYDSTIFRLSRLIEPSFRNLLGKNLHFVAINGDPVDGS